jgi:NDP-sugar pyrophosphorylase family protein
LIGISYIYFAFDYTYRRRITIYRMQVSDLINCGVYIFTPDIFAAIENVSVNREGRG